MPVGRPKRDRAAYMRQYRAKKKAARQGTLIDFPEETIQLPTLPRAPWTAIRKWAKQELIVPAGLMQGQRFSIQRWQWEFLRGALQRDVVEAGLSVARKNGKSGLVAVLLLAYLVGPLRSKGWRGIVCSLTGRLAQELLLQMQGIAKASGLRDLEWRATPAPGRVMAPFDIRLDCLAADKATGHALGADVCVLDEAGLLHERDRPLWNALLSCVSGRDGRMLSISIQGDGPMFAELQQRAGEPGVYWQRHSAPDAAALDDQDGWKAANPGLGSIKGMKYMRYAANRALRSPSDQSAFRAYDLNQPQEPEREMIVSVSDWESLAVTEAAPPRMGECCLGLDLGGSASMTAAVAFWPATGRYEAMGAFPAFPDLQQRGEADAVGGLYARMRERGELRTYPGRVTDVARFLDDVASWLGGQQVRMAADRYRRAECEEAMGKAGLFWPVEWRGQGHSHTADGSRDVRAFQRLVLAGNWKGERSLLMEQAIAQSSIARDASGNPKILRAKSEGRIDALQAGVLAAGLGERFLAEPPATRMYRGLA